MLPESVQQLLEEALGGPVEEAAPVAGGCIAQSARIVVDGEALFLKWSEGAIAQTFEPEAEGLKALGSAGSPIVVPEVVYVDGGPPGVLVLEWLDSGRRSRGYWERFGQGLAAVHGRTEQQYGFTSDNFIGQLPQQNGWLPTWPLFFRERRLEPQVERARADGRWRSAWDAPLEALYRHLPDLLPGRPPAALLHGDLWSGNALVTVDGRPAVLDPAVYYGHHEAEIAYTELFGGFDRGFYDAYREARPLDAGYEDRRDVYNLYHLINHLNHFGGRYAHDVGRVLGRFG